MQTERYRNQDIWFNSVNTGKYKKVLQAGIEGASITEQAFTRMNLSVRHIIGYHVVQHCGFDMRTG